MTPGLKQILASPGPLLLDFDGPVCQLFANYAAATASMELRGILAEFHVSLPDSIEDKSDPLEILRWTAGIESPTLTHAVEDALRAIELRAAKTAAPAAGATELMSAFSERGQSVAIVSNNSAPAIEEYLGSHELTKYVTLIIGREPYRPDLMKPNPEPLIRAVSALAAQPEQCVFIGDSLSDIEAAHLAGVLIIAYANRPAKKQMFTDAGADAVVASMAEVVTALPGG